MFQDNLLQTCVRVFKVANQENQMPCFKVQSQTQLFLLQQIEGQNYQQQNGLSCLKNKQTQPKDPKTEVNQQRSKSPFSKTIRQVPKSPLIKKQQKTPITNQADIGHKAQECEEVIEETFNFDLVVEDQNSKEVFTQYLEEAIQRQESKIILSLNKSNLITGDQGLIYYTLKNLQFAQNSTVENQIILSVKYFYKQDIKTKSFDSFNAQELFTIFQEFRNQELSNYDSLSVQLSFNCQTISLLESRFTKNSLNQLAQVIQLGDMIFNETKSEDNLVNEFTKSMREVEYQQVIFLVNCANDASLHSKNRDYLLSMKKINNLKEITHHLYFTIWRSKNQKNQQNSVKDNNQQDQKQVYSEELHTLLKEKEQQLLTQEEQVHKLEILLEQSLGDIEIYKSQQQSYTDAILERENQIQNFQKQVNNLQADLTNQRTSFVLQTQENEKLTREIEQLKQLEEHWKQQSENFELQMRYKEEEFYKESETLKNQLDQQQQIYFTQQQVRVMELNEKLHTEQQQNEIQKQQFQEAAQDYKKEIEKMQRMIEEVNEKNKLLIAQQILEQQQKENALLHQENEQKAKYERLKTSKDVILSPISFPENNDYEQQSQMKLLQEQNKDLNNNIKSLKQINQEQKDIMKQQQEMLEDKVNILRQIIQYKDTYIQIREGQIKQIYNQKDMREKILNLEIDIKRQKWNNICEKSKNIIKKFNELQQEKQQWESKVTQQKQNKDCFLINSRQPELMDNDKITNSKEKTNFNKENQDSSLSEKFHQQNKNSDRSRVFAENGNQEIDYLK